MLRRGLQVHRWLIALWICFLARGAFYAAAFPLWEGFDEWAHFAVIQRIALRGERLVDRSSPISRQIHESLELAPVPWELRYLPLPSMTHDAYWRLPAEERSRREAQFRGMPSGWAREDAAGSLTAYEALQPPLYYWIAAPVARAMSGADLGTQVLCLRWLGVAIASIVIPLAFLAARSVFRSDSLALGCAAVIAAMPEFAIDVARAGNECVAVVLFTLLTWLVVESVRGELHYSRALFIGVILGLGLLSKAYFLTAVPSAVLLPLFPFPRDRKSTYRVFSKMAVIASSSLAIAAWWYIRNIRTTGTVSGLSEAVLLRGESPASMLHRAAAIHWFKAIDAILFSHLWFGGWSSLTVRSWMYHLFYLLILLSAIGLFRQVRRPEIMALIALYLSFWIGQLYNVLLLFLTKGLAVSMGWYLYAVAAAEVALAIAGLRAISPPALRRRIPSLGVLLFVLLDLYTIHAVAIPYYTGVIAHRNNGALAALHLPDIARIGIPAILNRLSAYKTGVLNEPVLAVLWAAYFVATVALIPIGLRCCMEKGESG